MPRFLRTTFPLFRIIFPILNQPLFFIFREIFISDTTILLFFFFFFSSEKICYLSQAFFYSFCLFFFIFSRLTAHHFWCFLLKHNVLELPDSPSSANFCPNIRQLRVKKYFTDHQIANTVQLFVAIKRKLFRSNLLLNKSQRREIPWSLLDKCSHQFICISLKYTLCSGQKPVYSDMPISK